MGWETRGKNQYYYTKMRLGDRVISQYVGNGETAQLIAQLEEINWLKGQEKQQKWRSIKQAEQAKIRRLDYIEGRIRAIKEAVLLVNGYHQHKRQWRKWRNFDMAASAGPVIADDRDEIYRLMKAVDKKRPDKKDVAALILALRQNPELWRSLGDMANNAATHLIDTMQAPQSLKLSLQQGWKYLQAELGAESATALEKLLIQQVVISWLRLNLVEYSYTTIHQESITLARGDYWERRLNAAQRRFLRACSTLARVRKMDLPPIQVNIAQQQVNQVNR